MCIALLSSSRKTTVAKTKPTAPEDLQELWRPAPAFIGPLMPPMLLWFARGRRQGAWEIAAEARHAAGVRRWEANALIPCPVPESVV